jgi:hypothetical protein
MIASFTTSKYNDSPLSEPNIPLFRDVFLVVFGHKKVSRIQESSIGICGSWSVQALNCHMTPCEKVQVVYPNLEDNMYRITFKSPN